MKAIVFRRYGAPDVLQSAEMPAPEPRAGEIQVRVCASTVSSGDLRLRRADPFFMRAYSGWRGPTKISILGMEFSGHVAKIGKDVKGFGAGDAVFGSTGLNFGAYAELACAPAIPLAAKAPRNLPLEDCAALSYGGSSALHFLRAAEIGEGARVLVYGATGNVGTFAVQIAKIMGAHVTAICGARNSDFVKGLGADETRDYATDASPHANDRFDMIFDTVGKSKAGHWLKALEHGGCYAFAAADFRSYIALALRARLSRRLRVLGGIARTRPGDLDVLRRWVEEGKLVPTIDRRYPLEEIAAAHRFAEEGHKRGSVVVRIGDCAERHLP